ncbi:hypothetical protein YSA_07708 [Pseudomonas putida ND6]|uniref:Uncharacterized protein n=1 Tax=Pseudomonas putida ND6 TaxID=231023 RepID=I3UZL6_PSEPU|nr:hypothetical protein YSA_07708 [Pseudomonas putida ND6]
MIDGLYRLGQPLAAMIETAYHAVRSFDWTPLPTLHRLEKSIEA